MSSIQFEVRVTYREVPYHNFYHCCDVTHATYRFLRLTGERLRPSRWEQLALLLAAICHDMDHPGGALSIVILNLNLS